VTHAGHAHGRSPDTEGRRGALNVALSANGLLLVAQVAGGIVFGSLALLADSVHQFADVLALIIAVVSARVAGQPGSAKWTYGLRRIEVLGAAVSGGLLLAGAAVVVLEAFRRGDATDLMGGGVIALGVVGLGVNGFSAYRLSRVAGSNLNLRSAVVHLTADAAGSVGVLIAGLAEVVAGVTWVDTAIALLIAVMVVWSAVRLLHEAWVILLEAAPEGIDIDGLAQMLGDHDDVSDVHHLHVWSIDSETVALTAHVKVDREDLHGAQQVADELAGMLTERGIDHSTLQVECHECD
jgi:cobalt-zinc-cadmium efflux system protein